MKESERLKEICEGDEPTCRDCVLVKVDEASGGDVDGCLREDIIDELAHAFPEQKEELEKLQCEEDGKGIAINIMDFHPENPEEFQKCSNVFWKMRDRMYYLTRLHLLYKIGKLKEAQLRGIIQEGKVDSCPSRSNSLYAVRYTFLKEGSK